MSRYILKLDVSKHKLHPVLYCLAYIADDDS